MNNDWQPIETASKYHTITLRTAGGFEFEGFWTDSLIDSDDNNCGGWAAEDGYPPCWTDGVCWEVNADGKPSDPPTHWRSPHPVTA